MADLNPDQFSTQLAGRAPAAEIMRAVPPGAFDDWDEGRRIIEGKDFTRDRYIQMAEDVRERGVQKPVVIRELRPGGMRYVHNGHHRLVMAEQMGLEVPWERYDPEKAKQPKEFEDAADEEDYLYGLGVLEHGR